MTPLRLLLCFLCMLPVQAAKTACRVPSVRESDMTTLTCYFPEDVSQSKKDFAVYHYSGNERPDPVVDCLWVGGKLNCYTKPGYTYNTIISNEAVVQIPQVSANQTGKYTCQISGSQPEDLEFCELYISPETRTCELHSEESKEETRLTCIFPENMAQYKKDFAVHHFDDHGRQVVVVDCFWYMDGLSCKTHPGYQADKNVTDRFEVRILQTSGHQNGSYLCEMTGSRPNYVSICSFPQGGHVYEMATYAARGSSNAAVAVLGILLAIALAVIVCVIIYIKCNHPQVLQNITRCQCQNKKRNAKSKEAVRSIEGDGEEAKELMTKRENKTIADRARAVITNTWQRVSRSRNAAPTDLEMDVEQAGSISDEQFLRKGKMRSFGVETDRVQVETAAVQITEEDFKVFDPKPRAVPETRAEFVRHPEHGRDNVTVEVEETSDSTKKKKSILSFFGSKPKSKEKEPKSPSGNAKDTVGDNKHVGIHNTTKIKSTPTDQQSFERRNKEELSGENLGHGRDKSLVAGYEAESSSRRREPSEAGKYPETIKYAPVKAASASAVLKSPTPVSEESHTADADRKKSKPKEEERRQTEGEVDTRRHSRPVENPPHAKGDKQDLVPVHLGYAEYPEEPRQRQARLSSTVLPETGTEETSDKKKSKNKKPEKQDRTESDAKDKSKGGFWRRSKKQKEEKVSAAPLTDTMYGDAEQVETQVVPPKISHENEDSKKSEEKKKKTSGFFSRSPSKKDAKTAAAAAAPLLGDKTNENAEETDPQPKLIQDSGKRKDSNRKKENEKTSRKSKA